MKKICIKGSFFVLYIVGPLLITLACFFHLHFTTTNWNKILLIKCFKINDDNADDDVKEEIEDETSNKARNVNI